MISKEDYKNAEIAGITYSKPKVYLLQESGLGTSEFAGRTAYNSFDKSENTAVIELNKVVNTKYADVDTPNINHIKPVLNDIEHSDLLDQLAHVYHHDSVLEHCNLTFLVKGTSRGVLQEHARHRIQSITVQSTRYTMSSVINAFNASDNKSKFRELIKSLDMFVITGVPEEIEINCIYDKLEYQFTNLESHEFLKLSTSKEQREFLLDGAFCDSNSHRVIFNKLQSMKQKRNVGDNFKWIVSDNWKVDLVFTMNLRALSNYLKLRDSGAAYFQIHWLAEEIIKATPQKYLDLISKKYQK